MGKARKTRAMREQERRRARMTRMLIAGGTAVLLVVVLVVVQQVTSGSSGGARPEQPEGVADVKAEFAGLPERAGTIGNANAKVTITEYGDLRCPICKTFDNEVAPQVISDIVRPGTAKLQYKTWPILGPNSVEAAKAAYAARRAERALALRRADVPESGQRERRVVHAGGRARPRRGRRPDLARFDKDRASAAATKAIAPGHQRGDASRPRGHAHDPGRRPKGTITVDADVSMRSRAASSR